MTALLTQGMAAVGRIETFTRDAARPTFPERLDPTRTSQSLTQRLKGFVLQEPAVRERHSFRSQLYRMYDGRPFH
jgi:hypothetical protein